MLYGGAHGAGLGGVLGVLGRAAFKGALSTVLGTAAAGAGMPAGGAGA